MDTKSLHSKHPKKMKSSKDKHEVFVLPPDLLKKLGISIGNINGSQVVPDDVNGLQNFAIENNEHIENIPALNSSQKPSDSSILETANLMKKSVFLSPTFVSTVANAIPGEVEISSKNITDDTVALTDLIEPQDIIIDPADSIVTKILCDYNDIQEEDLKVDQCNITLNGEQTSEPNINQEYLCNSVDESKKQGVDFNMTFDDEGRNKLESKIGNVFYGDHSFENENNVYSTSTDRDSACVTFNSNNTKGIPVPEVSEIDINSEETIPLSKLKEIKRLQSLNGIKIKPVTVRHIIDTKINIEKGNSESLNILEPNSTVLLENTETLQLGEVEIGGNADQNNSNHMDSNEQIEDTAVFRFKDEEARVDITSNVVNKYNNKNRTLSWESTDKDSTDFSEDNTNKVNDCPLNGQNKTSEADGLSANSATVTGFVRNEEVVNIDTDKSVTICNGQIDGCTEPAVDCNENHPFTENEHKCIEDNKEKKCSLSEAIDVVVNSVVKENIKQICNNKQKPNSKNTLESDTGLKKLIEHQSPSQNVDDKTIKHDDLARILDASKNLSSTVTEIKVDKVKEIAAYLRKFSHIYTDKKKTKTALSNDIAKKKTINSNKNTIESKLCIQGVEKPGGIQVDREHTGESKVLKTYARRNPSKPAKLSTLILRKNKTCAVGELDLDLDAVNVTTKHETQEFCLCNDFGRLAYYDCDNLYEHIHFWQHHTAKCELDLIFAIYSDEAVITNSESGLEQEEKTEEKKEAHNICWNLFQSEFSENIDKCGTELIRHNYEIDILHDACSGDSPQVPVSNVVALKVDEDIASKTQDKVYMNNNSNSDVILETIDHEMVDIAESKNSDTIISIEKPLNTNINDNNSAAGSKQISRNTGHSPSQPKLTSPSALEAGLSEISNNLDKASEDGSDEETSCKRRQSSSNENKFSRKEIQLDSPKANNKTITKRRLSGKATPGSEPSFKKSVKCAICNDIFSGAEWESHVADQHHFIAWRVGGYLNLDEPELVNKLKKRLKTVGMLECSLCTMQIKKFNRFMEHIKYCIQKKLSNAGKKTDKPARKSRTVLDENVTCGVCQTTMPSSKWLEHIGSVHNYLAWKQGQETLNVDNESQVWQHLQNIIRLNGSLTCYKCGLQRCRVKNYQAHIRTCGGNRVSLNESAMSVDLNTSTVSEDITIEQSAQPTSVNCGVCGNEIAHLDWIDHICKEHNYLAWQEGDTPLNLQDQEVVWNHLQQFIRQNGGLTCHKCGLVRKRVKMYLTHIETCDGTSSQMDNSNNLSLNTTAQSTFGWFEVSVVDQQERKIVKCGVCTEEVPILEWLQHVGKEHDYLAWQDGATPLDLENELAVKMHLLDVSKQCGGLACNKCEKRMKYPKTYQQHIKECTGPTTSPEILDMSVSSWIESLANNKIKDEIFTCALCADKVESEKWIKHISLKHEYLAWVEGQPPLDLHDPVVVQKHLNDVSKVVGGLMCVKCGVKRKYVKSYLLHIETCLGKLYGYKASYALMCQDIVECAVCGATMEPEHWREHAIMEHYNIAWVVGDNPIEINNPYAVESYLKEYVQAKKKLVCKVCKISRVSYVGFYAHIIVCGKTEKETEIYKSVCDLCNNKYLRIYKSQHMTMHREKEHAMERKLMAAKEKALKKDEDIEEVVIQSGRRKAAEKAKNVIEKYKSNFHDGNYNCPKCGFNSENEKELKDHVCVVNKWGDTSDSDESVNIENCSGDETDESDETDIDSNVSDEEREAREEATSCKKKKHSDSSSSKICRLPYQIANVNAYMKKSAEEFISTYLTDEDLYPMWHSCELEEVPEDELVNYMPPIEESCKVRFDENQDWVTFNRFESSRVKDTIVLFLGASIQCMSWVPSGCAAGQDAGPGAGPQLLCAAPHGGPDAPRRGWDVTHAGAGLIQIWDCGNLIESTPKFALGIAHDFGTVWAIDWCPSGARDAFTLEPSSGNVHRLGLMAAACSNGIAYIFVVPYPTSISEKENPLYKLKPVAELRMTSNENRKVYQATAIKWSVQKGHSHVVVGYADGTTAYYDLKGESPLLKTTQNNRTVFYPYHDERVQNSCIEDVDVYPSGRDAGVRAGGVVCVGSAAGAGAGPLQSHVAAAKVLYPPHWPAALLAGDDCLVTQSINELEWWGSGRRVGGACGAAGCAWCARVCVAAPPLLKLLRVHPAFPDLHKQVIGRIMMIPIGAKRKRQNDELGMIVEPINYSDAVKKYGVEFKHITARDRTTQQKLSATPRDVYPERFPLSDVAAMQFCPTFKQHHKLALAMHAGLIFIINV